MNVDSVKSKYFSIKSTDDSLSDFQETKKKCKGPKPVQNLIKTKRTRVTKHIKGQRDIKTAFKGKKNELISYSKQFNSVCKQAGVDVDSEQLQLAVALSKSLQTEPENAEKPEPLSAKERVGKIRATLQEYGFKVPDIKIPNKKTKKRKRDYKLLLITEEERSQVISDRYSKVLFDNLESNLHDDSNSNLEAQLFYVTTNISYKSMRDDGIFYINKLVEKSAKIGSILRDWSNIPGRPVSPKLFDTNTMDFSAIDCSQNELDVILSGSIKSAQSIINSKEIRQVKLDAGVSESIIYNDESSAVKSNDIIEVADEKSVIKTNVQSKQTITPYCRSCSPDLFDDEVSSIMDNTKSNNILSQEQNTKVFTEDIIEITECAYTLPQNSDKLSVNITNRKSNDFMELTECIATSSQPILENHDHIDLTQSPDIKETSIKIDGQCSEVIGKEKVLIGLDVECMDLPQPLDNKTLQTVIILNVDLIKDLETDKNEDMNIDLTQSSNDADRNETEFESNGICISKLDTMDITQSSNSSDDLPFVQLSSKVEDTIILDENEYLDNGKVKCSILPNAKDSTQEEGNESDAKIHSVISKEGVSKSCDQSFFEEFVHDHSESIENELHDSFNEKKDLDLNDDASDIDLTQDSDSSIEITNSNSNHQILPNCNNISTDYDEVYNNTSKNNITIAFDDVVTEIKDKDDVNSNDLNSSQNTEFEISDKELDYSLHKSRYDIPNNFEFGGISILDDVTVVNRVSLKEHSIINHKHNLVSDNFIAEVNVKSNLINNAMHATPMHSNEIVSIPIATPNNADYIVKTDDVTPIVDYGAMTTPQRNRELDKYGLKPFKRKRAVQLLTHLYNQTHPIVEQYSSEDQPSPSKKPKKSPEKVLQSPNKGAKSREEVSRIQNNDIMSGEVDVCTYEVTSDVPAVRSIECDPEEWVFQKREKAKVHSCRVPLHIAFHNYVSSRRELREAILKYEPVNIDVIHKELVGYGHRYDPKDLLKFLDKKCITVKTSDNNARNNKKITQS